MGAPVGAWHICIGHMQMSVPHVVPFIVQSLSTVHVVCA
jgi:hypothetical protein